MVLTAVRNDYRAVETYRCPLGSKVSCSITVLVGDADPKVTPDDAESWREHTEAEMDLHVFPGGHFYLAEPRYEVLAVITSGLLP
ncbi:thioesterase II family protein [Saccharopolyspora pogona]|uniref:thioesterase II family protein n=1 Tax=Saccharopolyspora pogona TaxID=333966 RepID=UPI00295BB6D4|nr:thioesterase domain-containing protein [Saccharopolyspora pogona]